MPGQHSARSPGRLSDPPPRETPRRPAQPVPGASPAAGLVNTEQVERSLALPLEKQPFRRAQRCKRRTITSARLMHEASTRGGFRGRWLMLTLTYRPDVDWDRRHMGPFMQRARVWFRRQGLTMRYLWVLELTKAGAVHYHALVFVPRHLMLPTPDRRGWWPHGLTRTEVARNPVGYLAKYASKGCSGEIQPIPRSARICGGGGLEPRARCELRWWMTPRWFRERVPEITDVRRVSGGYVDIETGELHESPWRFIGFDAGFSQLLFVPRNPDERPSSPLACAD